jgi:hypothetical protein
VRQSSFALADMVGAGLGSAAIRRWAQEGMEREASQQEFLNPTTMMLSDIEDTGDFTRWAVGMLGQQLPIMGSIMAGGGVGGAIARTAARRAIQQRITQATARAMQGRYAGAHTPQEITRAVREAMGNRSNHEMMTRAVMQGSAAGAFPPGFNVMAGGIHTELSELGIDAPGAAAVFGAGAAALNTLPVMVLMNRVFAGVDRQVARSWVSDFARTMGIQASLEGPTEFAQETVMLAAQAYHDPSFDITAPLNRERVLTAAAAGALVGAVTGGLGEVGGGLRRAATSQPVRDQINRFNEGTRTWLNDRVERSRRAAYEQADADVPGSNDARNSLVGTLREQADAILQEPRARIMAARDQVNELLETETTGVDLESTVSRVEAALRARLQPEIDVILDTVNERVDQMRDAARDMAPDQRPEFIQQEIAAIRQIIERQLNERIRPHANQVDDTVAENIETRDMGLDEDWAAIQQALEEGAFEEAAGVGPVQDGERLILGQPRPVRRTFGGVGVTWNANTRGDQAVPFATRDDAGAELLRVRRMFPNMPEDAIQVRQQGNGYVVAVLSEGNAEQVFTQLRLADGLEEARQRARLILDKKGARPTSAERARADRRRVQLLRPGATRPTTFDVPTLAFMGRDLAERSGVEGTGHFANDMLTGLQSVLGTLLEQGWTMVTTEQQLMNKTLFTMNNGATAPDVAFVMNNQRRRVSGTLQESIPRALAAVNRQLESPGLTEARRKSLQAKKAQLEARLGTEQQASDPSDATPVFDRPDPSFDPTQVFNPDTGRYEALDTTGREVVAGLDDNGDVVFSAADPGGQVFEGEAGLARSAQDATNVETEAQQNARSAREPSRRTGHTRKWIDNNPLPWVNMSRAIPQEMRNAIQRFMNDMQDLLGLRNKVTVVDDAGIKDLIDQGHPMAEALRDTLLRGEANKIGGRIMALGDDVVIYLNPRTTLERPGRSAAQQRAATFQVLAHEMGHLVEFVYYQQLPDNMKQRVKEAYDAAMLESVGGDQATLDFMTQEGTIRPFDEWMADQFVAWSTRSMTPRDSVQRFFKDVGDFLRKVFDVLRGKYPLNETYNEFIEGVAQRTRETSTNEFAQHFLSLGIVGRKWFTLRNQNPQAANFELRDLQNASVGLAARIRETVRQWPGPQMAGSRLWETMLYLHDQVTSSLNGSLRRTEIPAIAELAEIFNPTRGPVEPGTLRRPGYHTLRRLHDAMFGRQARTILNKYTAEQLAEASAELIAADGRPDATYQTEAAQELRTYMDGLGQFMVDSGLPLNRVQNYWPRMWDTQAIENNRQQVEARLVELGVPEGHVASVIAHLVGENVEPGLQEGFVDPLLDTPYQGFLDKRSQILGDSVLAQYRITDTARIVESYTTAVVKRAAFNRALGEDFNPEIHGPDAKPADARPWDSIRRYSELYGDAIRQGATPEQLKLMRDAVDANLGRYGRNIPPNVRNVMTWVMTYQNVSKLLFATLASFPDIVGPYLRSNDFKLSFNSMKRNIADLVKQEGDITEMARTFGAISDQLNTHVVTEYMDNHWFSPQARAINESFFRWTGLQRWTNFTRAAALSVGVDFIKARAAAGDAEALAQLGLTVDDVVAWHDGGEKVFGKGGYQLNDIDVARTQQTLDGARTKLNEAIAKLQKAEAEGAAGRRLGGFKSAVTRADKAFTVAEAAHERAKVAHGQPGMTSAAREMSADQRVAEALMMFVDESIMRPNPSQRPLWASHPAFMLLFHLKSFFYSFYDTFLRNAMVNFQQAGTPWQKAYVLAVPAAAILALAAFGLELREQLQYKMWGQTPRTDRMDASEYLFELVQRGGMLGPAQLAVDWEAADQRGQLGFVAVGGPTLNQINEIIAQPLRQSGPKAIPVVGQVPALRAKVRDLFD